MKIEFGAITDEPFEVSTKYKSIHVIPIDDVPYQFSFVVTRVDTTSTTSSKPMYHFTEFTCLPVMKDGSVVLVADNNDPDSVTEVAKSPDPQRIEGIKDLLKISILEHLAKNPLARGFKDGK